MSGSRLALLALGGLSLLAGLAGALVLLGLGLGSGMGQLAAGHGLLMVLGFLGTMIALERAVALGARWAFLSPLLAGLAALSLIVGAPRPLSGLLLLAAGLVFVGIYVAYERIAGTWHTRIQALGALAWPVAAVLVIAGQPVRSIVPWLAALLVLTIAGERLELSRLVQMSATARHLFGVAVGIFVAGVVLSLLDLDAGMRVAGLGLLAMAIWLARHDLARRTVHVPGVTRFIAISLLIGYAWLAVAGVLWLTLGAASGLGYDAQLHALFLGFVISMVFGHAPVIVPGVLRVALPYRSRFYVHLALLHIGLAIRVFGGDALGVHALWQLGGVLDILAMLLFMGSSAIAVVEGFAARRSDAPSRPRVRWRDAIMRGSTDS